MEQYYKSASGALYYIKKTNETEVTNIPLKLDRSTLVPITGVEYASFLTLQEISKKERRQAAVRQYHASELETAKEAYEELRRLGMSEKVARAMTKYHG